MSAKACPCAIFAISCASMRTPRSGGGRRGIRGRARGEGVPDAFFGETAESVERDIHDGLSLLPEDPEDIASLGARLDERFPHGGAACCAIDILAHDRASLAAGVPLRNLLGLAPAE